MPSRRIVTVVNGESPTVASQGAAPVVVQPAPGFVIEEHWRCDHAGPATLDAWRPSGPHAFEAMPDPGGVAFRLVTFPPGLAEADMHGTATLDLVVVLDGAPELCLDDGTDVTLQVGDTVIQCGAVHGWRNRSETPATIAVVLLSAEDVARINS